MAFFRLGRRRIIPKDLQNFVDRRQEQKEYYNKGSHDLEMLKDGQNILYFDQRKGHWLPGIIVKKVHDRSYQLVTQGGRQITRNRRQLKPHPGKVEVELGRPNPPVETFPDPSGCPIGATKHQNCETLSQSG